MNLRTLLAAMLLTGTAVAQSPAKPGPEVKKLDYFVGTWIGEGTIQPGPWGSGGKYRVVHTFKWATGNFVLVHRTESNMPSTLGGYSESISLMGYDADKKIYVDTGFDSKGGLGVTQAGLSGDTWTFTESETLPDGEVIHHRESVKMLSPTSYRAIFEVSKDGTNWLVMMDGTDTKK